MANQPFKQTIIADIGAMHPYFAEGNMDGKYQQLIENMRDEGAITQKKADVLLELLAGKTFSELANDYGQVEQNFHMHASAGLVRMRRYVFSHLSAFDSLYLDEVVREMREGQESRPETTVLYRILVREQEKSANLEGRISELEQKIADLSGQENYDVYNFEIIDIGAPNLVINKLRRSGYTTLGELTDQRRDGLIKHNNGPRKELGGASECYLDMVLSKKGISLKGEKVKPYPEQKDFYDMPPNSILQSNIAQALQEKAGISTVGGIIENFELAHDTVRDLGPLYLVEFDRAAKFYDLLVTN
ncbi:MAG: hypothetical protein AABX51_03255 [Nanoarchaeota archaeon]